MATDSIIEAAKAALDSGDLDAETHATLQGLLSAIEADEKSADELNAKKKEVMAESAVVNDRIAEAYLEVRRLTPANPLGNMTIG